MSTIIGNSPINGRLEALNKTFHKWWFFLNALGIFSTGIAIGIHGSVDQHFKALVASLIVVWLFVVGRKTQFPQLWDHFRKSNQPDKVEIGKKIENDYVSFFKIFIGYFPMMVGMLYLFGMALFPLFEGEFHLYIPEYVRATWKNT